MHKLKYKITYLENVVKKDFPALSPLIKESIIRAIDERIATEPTKVGIPLLYELKGHRRLQVSDYRIIYTVDIAECEVTITAIKHRKESYRKKN